MKKISLKDVKNGLKRDEMRTIFGGSGGSGGSGGDSNNNCCYRQFRNYAPPLTGQYSVVVCDVSKVDAQNGANGGAGSGNYCCGTGCNSASWV